MKKTERAAAPAIGNAIGLFVGLWAIDKYEFLPATEQEYIVLAFGTLFIHILIELRVFVTWLIEIIRKRSVPIDK